MITNPQFAEIPSEQGKPIIARTSGDEFMEIQIGDEKSLIKREDLYGLVFVLGDSNTQDALMPVRQTTIRKYYKQHRVKVKKSLKAGDELVVNCEYSIPTTVEEGLKGLIGKARKSIFSI